MASTKTLIGLVSGNMAEKHIAKAELAARLHIRSTQTLNNKLNGTSELSLREAKGLADFCDVSLEEICLLVFAS